MTVVMTAGYDRAAHSVLVAERLRLAGMAPDLILLAVPASAQRLKSIIRNRGASAILKYVLRREENKATNLVTTSLNDLGIESASLRAWAKKHKVKLRTIFDFESEATIVLLRELEPEFTIYTGGGILRSGFLSNAGTVLNAHSGKLPEIRGMFALEWSLLLGSEVGVTIHVIDKGIDTGPILQWLPIDIQQGQTLDQLRDRAVITGANGLVDWLLEHVKPDSPPFDLTEHRQCFSLAPALMELAHVKLLKLAGSKR